MRSKILEEFGDAIRTIRKERKMTQQVLADQAHLTHNFISRIELGKVNTSVVTLDKICKALDIEFKLLY
jgi:transcriptional regulator with XRE-family HTH domain